MSLLLLRPVAGTAPAAGSGDPPAGDNNPDNYAAASTTFNSKDYDSQIGSDVYEVPGDISNSIVDMTYEATGGYNGTGCWRATPNNTPGTEGNGGWKCLGYDGATIDADETNILCISYLVFLSTDFAALMAAGTGGYGASGHKIFDVFMYDSAGSGRDNDTRQVIKILRVSGDALVFSHLKGGAGNEYTDDGVNTQVDFSEHVEEWVWVCHVFDSDDEVTRSYIKFDGDAGVTKVLERWSDSTGHDNTPALDEPYVINAHGWHSGEGQTGAWFFWDDITSNDVGRYVKLDRLRVANGWVDPPF